MPSFVANLAARLVGERALEDDCTLEFNWRCPNVESQIAAKHRGIDDPLMEKNKCCFVDVTFRLDTMSASFGSLHLRDDHSVYCRAHSLTKESLQDHFGEQIDVDGTKADVLACALASALRDGRIRLNASEDQVLVLYDEFCGDRPILCSGFDEAEVPALVANMILMSGRHPTPDRSVSEETIKTISDSIKAKWEAVCKAQDTKSTKDIATTTAQAESAVTKLPDTVHAPQIDVPNQESPAKEPSRDLSVEPSSASKRKPNNVKSRLKKKKKKTGTLSFVGS